jgi:hypothetical protein
MESERRNGRDMGKMHIYDYVSTWITILIIALIAKIILTYTDVIPHGTALYSFVGQATYFIIFGPGSVLLPLVLGAVMGAEIGNRSKSATVALRSGAITAIYVAMIYIIAIVALYEVMLYTLPQLSLRSDTLVFFMIIPQILVLIVIMEIFAALANARRSVAL